MPALHEIEDQVELEIVPEDGVSVFRPHWQIFVPTAVVLIGYGFSLLYLWASGRSDSALFRLCAIIAAVGVPLLAAHAFLRYETVRVQLKKASLCYHPGWPKDRMLEIPHELIETIRVKRGLAGRLFGGGTLVITTSTGGKIAIADLRDPDGIIDHFPQDRWEPAA
jgi:membrane protein YdbS with pleckstrin-like domain